MRCRRLSWQPRRARPRSQTMPRRQNNPATRANKRFDYPIRGSSNSRAKHGGGGETTAEDLYAPVPPPIPARVGKQDVPAIAKRLDSVGERRVTIETDSYCPRRPRS